ncbi:hypothetical protein CYMTET_35159 [Cymbomonas tetramitiformis]|uniref:Uncharacterized protein n=1 Tax=Cymbomonas tetramitiformis TaxID=36881 RepID=A0AAE0F9V1_9CHLO|nr:hypothetical protein CYMTET_35159 [Cymbomonas tetramitiformis]
MDLAAEHIPGVENTLTDGLSRYIRRKDHSDWQFRRDEFLSIQDSFTLPFTLDGGADPVGTNSHLPRYRSVVDGFEDTPVDGEHVYANPDYERIRQYLVHFLRALMHLDPTVPSVALLTGRCWWCISPLCSPTGESSLKLVVGLLRCELGGLCQSCLETPQPTVAICLGCSRLLCRECAGVDVGLTAMVRCGSCWLVASGWRPGNEALVRLVTGMLALRTRPSTDRIHRRGVRDISFFLASFCGTTLPATAKDVLGYCGYAVELREYRLDSSSVRTYIVGVSAWHTELDEVVQACGLVDSAGERYLRVFYRLRESASGGVTIEFLSPPDLSIPHVVVVRGDGDLGPYVRGRLEKDKNVDARKPRYFYMPEHIPGLGISPVAMLEEYVIVEGVPSGGLLFAAPKGATGCTCGVPTVEMMCHWSA